MKFEFQESDWGVGVTLLPESPAEMAMLMRITLNAAAKPAQVYLNFTNDEPKCFISIEKVKKNNQRNSMSRRNKH